MFPCLVSFRCASKLQLKSHSKNSKGKRYLTISKKISMLALANNILKNSTYAQYYELIPPLQRKNKNKKRKL